MSSRFRCVLLALLLVSAGEDLSAQGDEREVGSRYAVGGYVGMARHSPVGTHLGVIPDRDHLFIVARLSATMLRWSRLSIAYAPEIIPLLRVSNNPIYTTYPTPIGRYKVEVGRAPVNGFGLSPVGVEARVRVVRQWQLFGGGTAGVVWFTRDVPLPDAGAFNYMFDFGGGAEWRYSTRSALRVGYRFHHLSNAYRSSVNPGLDAHVISVGFQRSIGR